MNRLILHLIVLLLIPALVVDPALAVSSPMPSVARRLATEGLRVRGQAFTLQALSPAPPVAFETGVVSQGIDRNLGAVHGLPAAPALRGRDFHFGMDFGLGRFFAKSFWSQGVNAIFGKGREIIPRATTTHGTLYRFVRRCLVAFLVALVLLQIPPLGRMIDRIDAGSIVNVQRILPSVSVIGISILLSFVVASLVGHLARRKDWGVTNGPAESLNAIRQGIVHRVVLDVIFHSALISFFAHLHANGMIPRVMLFSAGAFIGGSLANKAELFRFGDVCDYLYSPGAIWSLGDVLMFLNMLAWVAGGVLMSIGRLSAFLDAPTMGHLVAFLAPVSMAALGGLVIYMKKDDLSLWALSKEEPGKSATGWSEYAPAAPRNATSSHNPVYELFVLQGDALPEDVGHRTEPAASGWILMKALSEGVTDADQIAQRMGQGFHSEDVRQTAEAILSRLQRHPSLPREGHARGLERYYQLRANLLAVGEAMFRSLAPMEIKTIAVILSGNISSNQVAGVLGINNTDVNVRMVRVKVKLDPLPKAAADLTSRERALLVLLGLGLTNKDIASERAQSEQAVKNAVLRLAQDLIKLQPEDVSEEKDRIRYRLMRYAHEQNLMPPEMFPDLGLLLALEECITTIFGHRHRKIFSLLPKALSRKEMASQLRMPDCSVREYLKRMLSMFTNFKAIQAHRGKYQIVPRTLATLWDIYEFGKSDAAGAPAVEPLVFAAGGMVESRLQGLRQTCVVFSDFLFPADKRGRWSNNLGLAGLDLAEANALDALVTELLTDAFDGTIRAQRNTRGPREVKVHVDTEMLQEAGPSGSRKALRILVAQPNYRNAFWRFLERRRTPRGGGVFRALEALNMPVLLRYSRAPGQPGMISVLFVELGTSPAVDASAHWRDLTGGAA